MQELQPLVNITPMAKQKLSEVLAALQRALDRIRFEHSEPEKPLMVAQPVAQEVAEPSPVAQEASIVVSMPTAVEPVTPAPGVAADANANDPPRRKKRPKSPPPAQDEWGFFDPEQCGLAALRSRLDEISATTKKPV